MKNGGETKFERTDCIMVSLGVYFVRWHSSLGVFDTEGGRRSLPRLI